MKAGKLVVGYLWSKEHESTFRESSCIYCHQPVWFSQRYAMWCHKYTRDVNRCGNIQLPVPDLERAIEGTWV